MALRLQHWPWVFRTPARVLILAAVGTSFAALAAAQTYNPLYSFKGTRDGRNPQLGAIADALYGTAFLGGDHSCACGTVFKLFPNGDFTVLHAFAGPDGANPTAALVVDGDGDLYGTTSQGGVGEPRAGTVFRLSPPASSGDPWTETVLHTFRGAPDGAHPYAGLIRDASGSFYGTTSEGGVFNQGTVFKLDSAGEETVLYSFVGSSDGANPYGGVVRDSAGNLFGTTSQGGIFNYGTVFMLAPTGAENILHSFSGVTDGAFPSGGLALDPAGNLYGTANEGGSADDEGTIFKADSTGAFTVLHTFTGKIGGANPSAAMVLDSSNNLYGTTNEGGDRDFDGTVFTLDTTTGKFKLLHTFRGGDDGTYPYTGVIVDSAGNLYGATVNGGTFSRGLVFKVAAR
jgi:uncharacterized repeat protein (TIGR03803 family)